MRVHSRHTNAYPEVSGYSVPTLLAYGERELALRLLRWLLCVQRGSGAFTDPDRGEPYVFDTGQVLRGLLAGAALLPGARDGARRAADWLCAQMVADGRGGFGSRYNGEVPESVHLYVLPPLVAAADVLGEPRYRSAAEACLEHYRTAPDFLRLGDLTHFLGYQLEALIDLGRAELARPVLEQLDALQGKDGAVCGRGDARWVCTPGLAQLAISWYKLGRPEPADRALSWLEAHQEPSGGFLGSYGRGAAYFPKEELSWAAKFFLDAHLLRTLAFFERNAHIFLTSVAREDGRAQALLALASPSGRVLEVGCGKGRFLKVIRENVPGCACTGVDISPALLACLPEGIAGIRGSLEVVPCPDNSFDLTFSVEAIEHSSNPEAAVREMARVTRPGGWVAIIDKHMGQWGRMQCPAWERWPGIDDLRSLLNRHCDEVTAEPVGYDGRPASDGLMVLWRGRKRGLLTGSQWHKALAVEGHTAQIVDEVRLGRLWPWAPAVILSTEAGEAVLEVGSGTGQISLQMALAGRRVTLLDTGTESLQAARQCAQALGVQVDTVCADATAQLPFDDGRFGTVWSSGLLEHFDAEVRRGMLREMARVASHRVIALVPNATCVAYRAGKRMSEAKGAWEYGLEMPIASLRPDFEAAGLEVLAEFTVGAAHGLQFLPKGHALRHELAAWLAAVGEGGAESARQGYLLVTMGAPAGTLTERLSK